MKNIQKDRGITLVALVITIIILLILAGITISQLTGSGLFENAKLAKEKSDAAQEKEDTTMGDYENKIAQYIDGSRDTITVSKEEWDKVEKVETISTTKLCYGNTTLNYDFSKYKRIRCYVCVAYSANIIFDIDLSTLNGFSVTREEVDIYLGSGTGSRFGNDQESLIFMCTMFVNRDKNCLTLGKLGFIQNSVYNNRIESGRENEYFVYKVEGIY